MTSSPYLKPWSWDTQLSLLLSPVRNVSNCWWHHWGDVLVIAPPSDQRWWYFLCSWLTPLFTIVQSDKSLSPTSSPEIEWTSQRKKPIEIPLYDINRGSAFTEVEPLIKQDSMHSMHTLLSTTRLLWPLTLPRAAIPTTTSTTTTQNWNICEKHGE